MDDIDLDVLERLAAKYPPPPPTRQRRAQVEPHDLAVTVVAGAFAALLIVALLRWESWGQVFIGGVLIGAAIVVCALALWCALTRRQTEQWWDE